MKRKCALVCLQAPVLSAVGFAADDGSVVSGFTSSLTSSGTLAFHGALVWVTDRSGFLAAYKFRPPAGNYD